MNPDLISIGKENKENCLILLGEPGIGKSRLIQEMTTHADQQGFQTMSAYCYQVEQSMPYQPLIDLVHQVMSCDDRWQQLAPVWLRELAVLVPEIGEAVTAATGSILPSDDLAESQQVRLFQAIFNLFANQAKHNKLLLVVEDIFWANPETLKCLHYLARRIARVPISIILSFRGETLSSDPALDSMLAGLRRETHFTYISLDRLTEIDTRTLLEHTTGNASYTDQLGNWLHQETEGNPFFFISLLQSLREEGLLDDTAEADWQTLARTRIKQRSTGLSRL
jgi:predicted ATPase